MKESGQNKVFKVRLHAGESIALSHTLQLGHDIRRYREISTSLGSSVETTASLAGLLQVMSGVECTEEPGFVEILQTSK